MIDGMNVSDEDAQAWAQVYWFVAEECGIDLGCFTGCAMPWSEWASVVVRIGIVCMVLY